MFVKRKDVAVAGFSFTLSDHAYSIHDIDTANDIVIVSFHGGTEGRSAMRLSNINEKFLGKSRGNVMNFSRAVSGEATTLVKKLTRQD